MENKIIKAILTNLSNYKESEVRLERVDNKYSDLPTYSIKGRKTVWGTRKLLFMKTRTTGRTMSAQNRSTNYSVELI